MNLFYNSETYAKDVTSMINIGNFQGILKTNVFLILPNWTRMSKIAEMDFFFSSSSNIYIFTRSFNNNGNEGK